MGHDDTPDHEPAAEARPARPVPAPPGASPAPGRPAAITPAVMSPGVPAASASAPAPAPATASEGPEAQQAPSGDADVPHTGDAVIDAVVAELAEVRERPLDEHIAAGEKAHRVLQGRLSDLGGE